MKRQKRPTTSLYQLLEQYPNEAAATKFFEGRRWENEPYCPKCGSVEVKPVANAKPQPWHCKDCRQYFSVRTGTILAESKVPLHKWLMAMWVLHTGKKGVSSIQLSKEIGVTQKTAWFLSHRIRAAMAHRGGLLRGEIEVDETYTGGKERNRHASQRRHLGRGPAGKQAIFGMRERGGEVRAFPVKATDGITLKAAMVENIKRGSKIYSDSYPGYLGLRGYGHESVAHSVGEYVRGMAHTNGIESFWSLLKRGYIGTHHHMSEKHIGRYVNEFAYRHNVGTDNTPKTIAKTVDGMIGRRLTYKDLIA